MVGVVIALAMMFGHMVVCLWAIAFLTSIIITMKAFRVNLDERYVFIKKILVVLVPLTIAYFLYTSVVIPLTSGGRTLSVVLSRFLSLDSPATKAVSSSGSSPLATALFSYGPMAVCLVVALIAWLQNWNKKKSLNDTLIEVIFLFGIIKTGMHILSSLATRSGSDDLTFSMDSDGAKLTYSGISTDMTLIGLQAINGTYTPRIDGNTVFFYRASFFNNSAFSLSIEQLVSYNKVYSGTIDVFT